MWWAHWCSLVALFGWYTKTMLSASYFLFWLCILLENGFLKFYIQPLLLLWIQFISQILNSSPMSSNFDQSKPIKSFNQFSIYYLFIDKKKNKSKTRSSAKDQQPKGSSLTEDLKSVTQILNSFVTYLQYARQYDIPSFPFNFPISFSHLISIFPFNFPI